MIYSLCAALWASERTAPRLLAGAFYSAGFCNGLGQADAIACVSRATADDAERLVARKNILPRISIVPMGLNYRYRKLPPEIARSRLAKIDKFNVNLPFALHVGSNLRRKNRDGVLRIFARCKDKWNGRLIFAGDLLDAQLMSLARELGVAERITQLEKPESETLEALYNCATALMYPSRFEGFGWPIIEAQACGCPVICANSGPLPEAAGDAGLFHGVDDEDGFASDLLRLSDSAQRATWSEKSLRNAERFSSEKMIALYIDIYRSLGAKL